MNRDLLDFAQQIKNTQDSIQRRCLQKKLRKFGRQRHFLFWNEPHKEVWREILEQEPPLQKNNAEIGVAAFPVYCGGENAALIRLRVKDISGDRDIFPNCKELVRKSFQKIAELMRRKEESRQRFLFSWAAVEGDLELGALENIEGRSLELAITMALRSFFYQKPISEKYVFTGAITDDLCFIKINSLKEKSAFLLDWRPKSWLVSPDQGAGLLTNVLEFQSFEEAWIQIQELTEEVSWRQKLEYMKKIPEYNRKARISCGEELLEDFPLQPQEQDLGELFIILCYLIGAYNHVGRSSEAMVLVRKVQKWMITVDLEELLDDEDRAELLAHCGTSFLDEFLFEEGILFLKQFGKELPRSQMRIHYLGSIASLKIAMGERKEALTIYQKTLELRRLRERKEHARTMNYMGNLFRLMGNFSEAEHILEQGLVLESDPMTKDYLRWNLAKVFARENDWQKADELLSGLRESPMKGFFNANLQLEHIEELDEIEGLIADIEKVVHPDSRLLKAFKYRAQALWYIQKEVEIPLELIRDLTGLNSKWESLELSEILRRIPY